MSVSLVNIMIRKVVASGRICLEVFHLTVILITGFQRFLFKKKKLEWTICKYMFYKFIKFSLLKSKENSSNIKIDKFYPFDVIHDHLF